MSNTRKLREALTKNDVKQWQLARAAGVSEWTLSRHLREEIDKKTLDGYLLLVEQIKTGRAAAQNGKVGE
jgi:hypothetical protein